MISPDQHKELLVSIQAAMPGIKSYIRIVDEDHFSKKLAVLRKGDYPVLVGTIPDGKTKGENMDSFTWGNTLIYWVLKHVNYASRSSEMEDRDYQETHTLGKGIIDHLIERQSQDCPFLGKLKPVFHLTPVHNMSSCDGWELTQILETS